MPKLPSSDNEPVKLRYSVSLVSQGKHRFYTLTMPSDVLGRTCFVTTRYDDPKQGFQRLLDTNRAKDIAEYIDNGFGTIPSSVVLSAQTEAQVRIIQGKTIEFVDSPKSFLVLDGQHRVYGFSLAKTSLRVPVVVYNGLDRRDESRLFIDINTKQRPVPNELLLDIRKLADYQSDDEQVLGALFDLFRDESDSPLLGMLESSQKKAGKISRVTFNAALKPLLPTFPGRDAQRMYSVLSAYFSATMSCLNSIGAEKTITKPVVLRALALLFKDVAPQVSLKFASEFTADNFYEFLSPMFSKLRQTSLTKATSISDLHDSLTTALRTSFTL